MKIIRAIRHYFDSADYWEVETPVLQTMPCADMHIHGFHTQFFGPDLLPRREFYLHTSPEFAMKKLLVAGAEKIYQICKVFRNGETTRLHSPEFTMLEWYRIDSDYKNIMDETERLLKYLADNIPAIALNKNVFEHPFERLSVSQAFYNYADICLEDVLDDKQAFAQSARDKGIRIIDTDNWDDIFHAVMADKIEPFLGYDIPVFLYDYPASMACLSKKCADPRFAERFELYINGIELANAFTELTDPEEQRQRFQAEMHAKQDFYGFCYPLDEDFLNALEHGMPDCAGIALGIDRLCMLLSGAKKIEDVLWNGKPA